MLPLLEPDVVTKPAASQVLRRNPWYWLSCLPDNLRDLPRLQKEVIPDLESTGFMTSHISFDISKWKLASELVQHCVLSIRSIYSKSPAMFKVGLTRNPCPRWSHYVKDSTKWMEMRVLAVVPDSLSAGLLEASLIHRFQHCPGNQNIARGGEGVNFCDPGPYFVYVVFRCLIPPKK